MLSFIKKTSCKCRFIPLPVVPVNPHLAMTPSDMNRLSQQGLPISSSMLSDDFFAEPHTGVDSSVPFFAKRGVTFSDVAVYQQESRRKIINSINES